MLEACVIVTVLLGFFGIVLKRSLVMKIVSMDVMSTGVIAYFVVIAFLHETITLQQGIGIALAIVSMILVAA